MSRAALFGLTYGMALGACGIYVTAWQFWLLMPLAACWAIRPEPKLPRDAAKDL